MSESTFPCEVCGAFHSASEIAEAGGYCPQCEADYDERTMLADLVQRYAKLEAELAKLREQVAELEESNRSWVLRIQQRGIEMDEMSQLIEDQAAELDALKSATVVMPNQMVVDGRYGKDHMYSEGWNDALLEVTDLNGGKP